MNDLIIDDVNKLKYKIYLDLSCLKLLLTYIKGGMLPIHLRWYYLGSLNELYELTKQDVKKLNQLTKEADG